MVKDQRPLNVTLKEDTRLIDEVVVVGYGVQKESEPDRCGEQCEDG